MSTQEINNLITTKIKKLQQQNILPADELPLVNLEITKKLEHGDFSCNFALIAAGICKKSAREIAQKITENLELPSWVDKVTIAGPGFINFFVNEEFYTSLLQKIITDKERFGSNNLGKQENVHLEMVSANPTGPLHVGHGRHAAYGATLANILKFCNFKVFKEYYINDGGRQIDILTLSVWLRYLEYSGWEMYFPLQAYRGDYIENIADSLFMEYDEQFVPKKMHNMCVNELIPNNDTMEDCDKYLDNFIAKAKKLLTKNKFKKLAEFASQYVLFDIQDDLNNFHLQFDNWFSEREMMENTDSVKEAFDILQKSGFLYEKDGATWFRSSDLGDEKDRVLVKANGTFTYFMPDIAYHWQKVSRKNKHLINIFGADHHGYVPRIKAATNLLAKHFNTSIKFDAKLVQFVSLFRGEEKVQMSTRAGSFITLRKLYNEVGCDAARFFYVMKKIDQHMDFDLELAKQQNSNNPVYYIQYAHARICSLFRKAEAQNITFNDEFSCDLVQKLDSESEKIIMQKLVCFGSLIHNIGIHYEVHHLPQYLYELAQLFHRYYNSYNILSNDDQDNKLIIARLKLCSAIKQIIYNGLTLLDISAKEIM